MKSVLILIALFFVVRAIKKRYLDAPRTPAQRPMEKPVAGRAESEEMVMDPVCGSYVPISTDFRLKESGKTVYFCGSSCMDKYREPD